MDQSRRAVESYWRSKMIDAATSEEDKLTPVYKLEEICNLLRTSHVSIVKQVSDFILKRLQHKSPIVKQKALRVIKYAVGKSGADFKREMQRNSVSIRQLIHHKGQPDPLKGDALNKSVRETAQEALSALFSGEDTSKPPAKEGLAERIQGFGNTNFDPPSDNKKAFRNEVVGIGSATIKHGLNNLTQTQTSMNNNNTGTYNSSNLRGSATKDVSGPWGQDAKTSHMDNPSGGSGAGSRVKSREERLLETIITSGGIRLQPTRDALEVFLNEALKLDALALSHALEAKLQSHMWQVCVRGLCVLEAILRKKDDEQFLVVASYFTENINIVVKCSNSPQASVREKANKVLSLLTGEQSGSRIRLNQQDKNPETEKPVIQMPDLIDTNDSNANENENNADVSASTASPMDDFFGDSGADVDNKQYVNDDDPFADVSFHGQNIVEEQEPVDIFSGLTTVDKSSESQPELLDLMAGLTVNKNESSPLSQNDVLSNMIQFQGHGMNPNPMFSIDPSTYNPMMLNPMAFDSQQISYAAMNTLLAQQQFLSTMNNLQSHLGPASSSSALPDIFNPIIASQTPTSTMNSSKKDDSKAFDFISDHLAAVRDPKRVN